MSLRARKLAFVAFVVPGHLVLACAALVAASLLTIPSPAMAESPCDAPERLKAWASERGFSAETSLDEGLFVRLFEGDVLKAGLWAGWLPDGSFSSQHRYAMDLTGAEKPRWRGLLLEAFELIQEAPRPPACQQLAISPEAVQLAATSLARMVPRRAVKAAPSLTISRHVLVLATTAALWLLWLVFVGLSVVRAARQRPREALWLLALVVAAGAARFLAAPRVPVVAATADMGHIFDALRWLDGVMATEDPAYPVTYKLLLSALFWLFGPSFELAFAATTMVGALTLIPVARLAIRLGGSTRAGVFAALSWLALPAAMRYANGVNLVTPAAFFAAASFLSLVAWLQERRRADLFLVPVSLALFAQCRGEGVLEALIFATMMLGMIWSAGRLGEALGAKTLWASAAISCALLTPHLAGLVEIAGHHESNSVMLWLTLASVAAALALAVLARTWSGTGTRSARARALAPVLALAVGFVAAATSAALSPSHPLFPRPVAHPNVAQGIVHSTMSITGPGSAVSLAGTLLDASSVPSWSLILVALSLALGWPAGVSRGSSPRSQLLTRVYFLALPMFTALLTTSFDSSGELHCEGLRYQIPALPFIAVLVGLGAQGLVSRLRPGTTGRQIAMAAMAVILLSPLVSHRALAEDVVHNIQREFALVREAMRLLPEHATVVLPDDRLSLPSHRSRHGDPDGGASSVTTRSVSMVKGFRTRQLINACARMEGKQVRVAALSEWLGERDRGAAGAWFFYGLECVRSPEHAVPNPSCKRALEKAGTPLVEARHVNRLSSSAYSDTHPVRGEEIWLAFLPMGR